VKLFSAILFICIGLSGFSGCAKQATEPNGTTDTTITRDLDVACENLRPPRPGENYVVWLKYVGDPSWHRTDVVTVSYLDGNGKMNNLFHHTDLPSPDSIFEVLISIEEGLTSHPTLPLMHGHFFQGDSNSFIAGITTDTIADFSNLTSSLVFISTNTQSTNDSEFYLCTYNGVSFGPSLEHLPQLTPGWVYALWAIDSNFYPTQRIFYGTFTHASGHDNDSVNDSLPFPGGAKPVAMNQKTGKIIVTLEPGFYSMSSLISQGPSQLSVLRFDRRRSIVRDSNYQMLNVASGLPSGTVTITTKK
jgi:hypothetical protein